jgi:hypothetical protein
MATPQITNLWNYISSAYADFQDKPFIENFWSAMGSGIQRIYDNVGNTQGSRTMSYMGPTFDYGPQRYIIGYSGTLPAYITASGTNIQIPVVTANVPGAENITNTDFEISTSGWVLSSGATRTNTRAHNGSWSLSITAGNSASYTFPAKITAPLHFEMWIYVQSNSGSSGVLLYGPNGLLLTLLPDLTKLNQWQKLSSDHLTSAITRVLIINQNSPLAIFADDVSLKNLCQFSFQTDEWTYSIPTLQYSYSYNGVTYSGVYTQGTDYAINSSFNSVLWIGNSPIPDRRYTGIGVMNVVAPSVYRINPALANIWCRAIGLDIKTQYPNYRTFGQDKYTHLKMFAWAMSSHRRSAPSIYTLRNAYGIARGLPFAYASGLLSWTSVCGLYNVTIGGYTHVFPSGIIPRPAGVSYNAFEVIASGLNLWDYTTNAGLIAPRSNYFNQNNTLYYQLDSTVSGLSFSQDFVNNTLTAIMPVQIRALTM